MLPLNFDYNHFAIHCSLPLTEDRHDPCAEQCVLWLGPKGSYNLIPPHMRLSVDRERKVTGKLRYFHAGVEYSARNIAFAYFRAKDMDDALSVGALGDNKRMRLKSLCKKTNCVNPWHHELIKRRKRVRTSRLKDYKLADRVDGSAPLQFKNSQGWRPIQFKDIAHQPMMGKIEKPR